MSKLGVNIDHVATIRQARGADEPDPVWAAMEAELGGADGITFHLREDRRHINDRDAELLVKTVASKTNLEMAGEPEIIAIALRLRPDQCTLVPERREERTTEGGLDVIGQSAKLTTIVKELRDAGITVSAFIEPLADQVDASKACGFDAIELWTGDFAHADTPADRQRALTSLEMALKLGHDLGLEVHAGHGITYRNVSEIARIRGFGEFNIGHSIVARSVFTGMREAVREMKRLISA